jgi:nitroreductase
MNPTLQILFNRRSVRRYLDKPVPDALIHDLLEAAMAAPSAVATDPWHFVVLRDPAVRSRLVDGLPNGSFLRTAPLGIAICGDLALAHDHSESLLLQDCSAAIENLLVAAAALGLGACWINVHPRPDRLQHVRTVLALPDSVMPIAILSIGWPESPPPPRTRFKSERLHTDSW